MHLPSRLFEMLQAVARAGGRPRLVGGCVRDWLLGAEVKDFDVEVFGLGYEAVAAALAPFGPACLVGRSFGVLKLRDGAHEHDFSLPRRDSKVGAGHRGFAVEFDPTITEHEAARRRDFTLNAIAWDPFARTIIDPLGGEADLRRHVLRHCGPAFRQDPLRVLRAFQFAARFGFEPAPETVAECRAIADQFVHLPAERVGMEWEKWAEKAREPGRGLRFLKACGWLAHFPALAALDGLPQDPEWHPEGDVLIHTGHCCDALARLDAWRALPGPRRREVMLAVLLHDVGKATTTRQEEKGGRLRWASPGHEAAGGPVAEEFLAALRAPLAMVATVRPLVELHMWHHHWRDGQPPTIATVRRLARRLAPATVADLCLVLRADHLGRPPLVVPATIRRIEWLERAAADLALADSAPRPVLLGRHLLALGLQPGPDFGVLLDAAFEAQLEGDFDDEAGGLEFLRGLLANRAAHRLPPSASLPPP